MKKPLDCVAEARTAWIKLLPETVSLFETLWCNPELPGMEHDAAQRLSGWLERYGFHVARQAGGVPTAFVASKRCGTGPRIAILAEYDALPGLANAATPSRNPTGTVAGHACGHNHIGPANTASAIAAASLGLPGEIAVIGCPAEEILWGKVALLNRGVFDGYDAILTSHGDYQSGAISRPCQAMVSSEFVFLGEGGHGGKSGPRNALRAAEAALHSIEQHLPSACPGVQMKHVLRLGGLMPSITPEEARLWIALRHVDLLEARKAYRLIAETCAAEASRCATAVREQFIAECRGYLANDVLAHLLQDCLEDVGPPQWNEDDLGFMRQLAGEASPGEGFTLDRGLALHDAGADYYGQDDGEVSWRIPLGRVNWAYPEQVPIHHWAWTALSGHAAGHRGALMASEALAMAAARLLLEPELISAARQELSRRTAGCSIDMPRLGAWRTMTEAPHTFWNASWIETTP